MQCSVDQRMADFAFKKTSEKAIFAVVSVLDKFHRSTSNKLTFEAFIREKRVVLQLSSSLPLCLKFKLIV